MDKFKELQEQHQQSPKEANPFLQNEQDASGVLDSRTVAEVETDPNSEVNEQSIEPEVIDNVEPEYQVKPDTAPTDHEGEE